MRNDELSAVEATTAVITDDQAPTRVSIGFSSTYRQHPSLLDWLRDNDLFAAIDTTRRAVRRGYIDESREAREEIERVRGIKSVERFVAERDQAREAYDNYCAQLPERLACIRSEDPRERIALLLRAVEGGKALDERLHAYVVNYNRPGTLIARLLDSLASQGAPINDVAIPPIPSCAMIEGLFLLTVIRLLQERGKDCGRDHLEQELMMLLEESPAREIVARGLWAFARGSTSTLARKLIASTWLALPPGAVDAQIARFLRRNRDVRARYEHTSSRWSGSGLGYVGQLLVFDHVEDALRSAVYNGLEDYIARQRLGAELYSAGVTATADPMMYSQNWLVAAARAYVASNRIPELPEIDRSRRD